MAVTKISELNSTTSLTDAAKVLVVDGGTTKQITYSSLKSSNVNSGEHRASTVYSASNASNAVQAQTASFVEYADVANKPTLVSSSAQIASSDLDMNGNKVLFANVYGGTGDLPSASTYHGMFAHVHSTGQGYFAHAGQWVELATSASLSSNTGSLSTKVDNQNANSGSISFWQGSQTEYNAISSSADPNTLYIIRS